MNTAIKVSPASKKSTTMYEVDDSNLGNTKFDSENRHYKPFYDFISSLGFDVRPQYKDSGLESHMMIDEKLFHIDFSKSPRMAWFPYGREYKERKDRCIELSHSTGGLKTNIKIRFNEEIDKDKLVAKIQKAIDAEKSWVKEVADSKDNQMRLLTEMRDHYYANRIIAEHVEYIMVEKEKLNFSIDGASIIFDASTGTPSEFIPYEESDGVIKVANIAKWASEKRNIADVATKVCKAIVEVGKPSAEFAEYAKEAYHRYVRKNRIEE